MARPNVRAGLRVPKGIAGRLVVAALILAGHPRTARAGEETCREAYEQSQELMKPKDGPSTLLAARAMLRTCMRSNCKDWMVADCSKWLTQVEERIPTIVFSARDTAGRDLTEIQVMTADGRELAARLDGRGIEMDPGHQKFVFVAPDGARREKDVLVREGQKSQGVAALFDAPPGLLPPASPTPFVGRPPTASLPPSKWTYVGYAAAGLGVVGLGLGAAFGLRAIDQRDSAGCDETNACKDMGAVEQARKASSLADVSLVAGGVLGAAGVALILFAPRASSPHAAQLRPAVGPSMAGLELGTHW